MISAPSTLFEDFSKILVLPLPEARFEGRRAAFLAHFEKASAAFAGGAAPGRQSYKGEQIVYLPFPLFASVSAEVKNKRTIELSPDAAKSALAHGAWR